VVVITNGPVCMCERRDSVSCLVITAIRSLKKLVVKLFFSYKRVMPTLTTFLKRDFKPDFEGKTRFKYTRLLALS
jgi:hypothetical protein